MRSGNVVSLRDEERGLRGKDCGMRGEEKGLMDQKIEKPLPPAILAPAGSRASFLAAVAAGADAIYCGLKQFSARMEAKNFSIEELGSLTRLAHDSGTRVFVAINTLIKPNELDSAGLLLKELKQSVKPDALILQDLSLLQMARQIDFSGELILSTLANVSFTAALEQVKKNLGVDRVVLPRELDIDEIKMMAAACPKGLSLEVFVHGALCYGVSGRCYWSSFMGGKSGLRGRCVQPCRRLYDQQDQSRRSFSCMDLSLDVLVKVLMNIPQVRGWKIEGRKKGPHYVFYTVKAYQMLRDSGRDPQAKKSALELLAWALGRRGTHYYFLPQRPQNPLNNDGRTGSGLMVGKVGGGGQKRYLSPREELLSGDVLRVGYEDEPWHAIIRVSKSIPKKGRLYLSTSSRKSPRKGTSVFLIDRREKALEEQLSRLEEKMKPPVQRLRSLSDHKTRLPQKASKKDQSFEVEIYRNFVKKSSGEHMGIWLSPDIQKRWPQKVDSSFWWCLPPVTWPAGEKNLKTLIAAALKTGGRNFILNAPWQVAFFKNPRRLNLWAGPFCNISNPLAIAPLSELGFAGVIASPELGSEDYLKISEHSPLPLGVVLSGNWPLCVSRVEPEDVKPETAFASPRGEQAWVKKYDDNFWVFPNWKFDIRAKKKALQEAGYRLFIHLSEPIPPGIKIKKRPGLWNWDVKLR